MAGTPNADPGPGHSPGAFVFYGRVFLMSVSRCPDFGVRASAGEEVAKRGGDGGGSLRVPAAITLPAPLFMSDHSPNGAGQPIIATPSEGSFFPFKR